MVTSASKNYIDAYGFRVYNMSIRNPYTGGAR